MTAVEQFRDRRNGSASGIVDVDVESVDLGKAEHGVDTTR
jgi:hypothetical protein